MTEKQKILIVDDRKESLFLLSEVLGDLDAEVVEATTGNKALAATLEHDFAVAILDVMMPGMDGYELAGHLRGDRKTRHIPIIFVTAVTAYEQHMFKGYEAGAIDYITKPYTPEIMVSKVNVLRLQNTGLTMWVLLNHGQQGERVTRDGPQPARAATTPR